MCIYKVKSRGSQRRQTWPSQALLFIFWLTLAKVLTVLKTQFPHLWVEIIMFTSKGQCDDHRHGGLYNYMHRGLYA